MSQETEIHFPRDLEGMIECRRLAASLAGVTAGAAIAWVAIWKLFRELTTNARPECFGVIEERDRVLMAQSLPVEVTLEHLVQCGLLVLQPDGSLLCPLFARHNGHLIGKGGLNPKLGGLLKSFDREVDAAREGGGEELALLPPDTFVDPTGKALDSETIRAVRVVIVALDNATGRTVRRKADHAADWPRDLVRAAVEVMKRHTLIEAVAAVRDLKRLGLMESPAIPRTTEAILVRFDAVVTAVESARKTRG